MSRAGSPARPAALPAALAPPPRLRALEARRDECRRSADYSGAAAAEREVAALKLSHEAAVLAALIAAQAGARSARTRPPRAAEAAELAAAQAASQPRARFSPQLLDMRHRQRALVAQRKFDAAGAAKRAADELERLELGRIGSEAADQQAAERAQLAARHAREREAGAARAASALQAAQRQRGRELEQLARHRQATRLSLELTHTAQHAKLQQSLRGVLGLPRLAAREPSPDPRLQQGRASPSGGSQARGPASGGGGRLRSPRAAARAGAGKDACG
ncbi:hypothetical protein HT031_001342 [Scenedesmus sp. PABB004]|nr:hypothetical protein HT031_001342 [Scenedesmus sp. PABB004]